MAWTLIFWPAAVFSQEPAPGDDEIEELNPFVLDAGVMDGYRATNTLAGSRIQTELRDVGSAIEVVTEQFLEDTGVTDTSELLTYTVGTEVGGTQGNFAGGGFDGGGQRTDQNTARINPQFNQRIRGLGSATLTRDFFVTSIPFDSYNSSMVTINRGPNSILFGVGDPGGIIDHSLNNASLGRNFTTLSARIGSNASYRATVDHNHVLLEDRLALRVSALQERREFNQRPAYEQDRRLYLAANAILLKNENSSFLGETSLRFKGETGEIKSNPPMVIPPRDAYSYWWNGLQTDYERYTGVAPPPNHSTLFESQHTVSLDKTPSGINTSNARTIAWTTLFDQGALVFKNPSAATPDANTPSFPTAEGLQGRLTFPPNNTRFEYFSTRAPETFGYALGFAMPVIQDRRVFDFINHSFAGNTSEVDRDFNAYNITLDQLFFEDKSGGIEISFDSQDWKPYWNLPVDDNLVSVYSNSDITIDISEKLATGDPNPNLGRPFVRLYEFGRYDTQEVQRRNARATAFYELKFETLFEDNLLSWLGNHTFTGFVGTQSNRTEYRRFRPYWDSNEIDMAQQGFNGNPRSFFRIVNALVYLGPSVLNASGPGEVRVNPVDIPNYEFGDSFQLWYQGATNRPLFDGQIRQAAFNTNPLLLTGNLFKNEIDTRAFTVQSRFLKGHLVTLAGWRTDESSNFEQLSTDQIAAITGDPSRTLPNGAYKEENFILQDEPSAVEEGDTFTGSVVAHVPESWTSWLPLEPVLSFHYAQSENFSPAGLRRDVFLNTLSPPSGETEEYGFSLELADRHFFRMNWFETSSSGSNAGFPADNVNTRINYFLDRTVVEPLNAGWTFQETKDAMTVDLGGADPISNITSFAEMEAAIVGLLPSDLQSAFNYRVEQVGGQYRVEREIFPGQVATASRMAKGFELSLVSNPIPGWRLQFNLAKQETVQSDSAPLARQLVDSMTSAIDSTGFTNLRVSPTFNADETMGGNFNRLVSLPLNNILAKDGTVSLEQRKWRANFITNYTFANDTFLDGFSVGGAVRWQDSAAIGYGQLVDPDAGVIPDLDQPFFGSEEWNGDVWAAYERPIMENVAWKIQLNIRNAFGDDSLIPVRSNPDGSIPVVRIPNETFWYITNTLEF